MGAATCFASVALAIPAAAILLPYLGSAAAADKALAPPAWVQQLREANCAQVTQDVSEMYEDLPYPPRDPTDEVAGEPFAVDPPSTPAAIAQHVYGGDLDFYALGRPFRVLIAGGGTGDSTVMAAVSFYEAQIPVEIVHCDLSAASIGIARRRLAVHGLDDGVKVTFYQRSFLELQPGDVGGPFDFANAVGVVHHLASPAEGLRALVRLLRPEGGLFLMVYGELGRTGVYDVQNMWRLSGLSRREFLAGPLQALLGQLPETNRFARNRRMASRKVKEADPATLSDLLAHNCDHAYTIASLLELLAEAGLRPLALADPGRYTVPQDSEAALAPLLLRLSEPWQRAHFAELLRGDIFMHLLWAAPGASPQRDAVLSPDAVLCPAWRFAGYRATLPAEDRARCLREAPPGGSLRPGHVPASCTVYIDKEGHEGLPCPAVPLLERLDCTRTVRELGLGLAEELRAAQPEAAALSERDMHGLIEGLYRALSKKGQQQVFLLRPGLRFRRPPWREKHVPRVIVQRDWDAAVRLATQEASGAAPAGGAATVVPTEGVEETVSEL